MSIPISITRKEYLRIRHELASQEQVICLNEGAHIATLLVGKDMLEKGMRVKARIVKGYK